LPLKCLTAAWFSHCIIRVETINNFAEPITKERLTAVSPL